MRKKKITLIERGFKWLQRTGHFYKVFSDDRELVANAFATGYRAGKKEGKLCK